MSIYFSVFKIFLSAVRLPVRVGQITNIAVPETKKQNIIQAVQDYGKRLFRFIRGRVSTDEDAEDILQDVWYQFTNVISREPIEQTSAWLFRVAKNRIIDKYRKQQPVPITEDETGMDGEEDNLNLGRYLPSEDSTPESEMLQSFFWEQLFAALNELPNEQKDVFIWNELEDISFTEIAERTGEKINTLISRKRYAVLHLRKRLEQLYKELTQQ